MYPDQFVFMKLAVSCTACYSTLLFHVFCHEGTKTPSIPTTLLVANFAPGYRSLRETVPFKVFLSHATAQRGKEFSYVELLRFRYGLFHIINHIHSFHHRSRGILVQVSIQWIFTFVQGRQRSQLFLLK